MPSSVPPDRSVILLHDQLQDARIWRELEPLVAAYASTRTITVPPLHTLGAADWADHIERHARETISPHAVDLAVTVGGAGEAGIGLVSSGHATAALLLDPAPTALAGESAPRLLHEPDIADRLTRFLLGIDPRVIEDLSTRGSLSGEQVTALVDASLPDNGHLSLYHRDLLRRMAAEQLAATLPIDVTTRRTAPDRPDWIARLAPVVHRCTIAIGSGQLYRLLDFEATLRRRAPDIAIVNLPSVAAPLQSAPDLNDLILDLLQR